MKVLLVIAVLMMIVAGVICISNYISLRNDIEGLKDRAQVAAEAKEIHDRLVDLDKKMEERGMRDGYTSLFERSPWTSVREIRENVKRLVARSATISELDRSSAAYQNGLDDLRGIVRELDVQAFGWWTWAVGGWVWLWLIGPLATLVGAFALCVINEDQ